MTNTENFSPSLPPCGFSRVHAAKHIGVSVGTFDTMVSDGRMPGPKRIGSRKVWQRTKVEEAFYALPEDESDCENDWDS